MPPLGTFSSQIDGSLYIASAKNTVGYFAHKYFQIETPLNKYIDNYISSRTPAPNTVAT